MIEITTRMEIKASSADIFDSFINPDKIGNFWFSNSSEKWETGKTISLSYEEFNAVVSINILELRLNKQIMLTWGPTSDERAVTISLKEDENKSTLVEVKEVGFQEYESLLQNPDLAEVRTYEYEEIINNLMSGKGGWTFVLTCLKAYLEHGITDLRTGLLG